MEVSRTRSEHHNYNITKTKTAGLKSTRMFQARYHVTQATFDEKRQELKQTSLKLKRAAEQLSLLNKKLTELGKRYNLAKKDNSKCFMHNLEMKLSTVQSMRNMYYNYVYMKAEDINMLRHELKRMVVADDTDTDQETEEKLSFLKLK
ncbi:hypothetical protein ACF0H5_015250 [Mactra antiquata]